MPEDWDNHEGWERYYAALYIDFGDELWIDDSFERLSLFENDPPKFVSNLKNKGWLKVWIPGCGMSPIPKILTELGLEVHATDISPSAVAFQQTRYENSPLIYDLDSSKQHGSFECRLHDSRLPYLENYFDLVINVKALSGFNSETIKQVAESHYKALKPSREAHFVTLNVQDERRDVIETCLLEAGFFMPFYELNRWQREKLREEGLSDCSYFQLMYDEEKQRRYIPILQHYEAEMDKINQSLREDIDSGKKLAQIYYLTG